MNKAEQWVRKNIRALQPYSSARDEFSGKAEIYLDANENPEGIWNRYPDPLQKILKARLARLLGSGAENIFLGNGSDEVIDLAFRIFCEPGIDKALCFSPTYGMYGVCAAIHNTPMLELPLAPDFRLPIAKLKPLLQDENLKLIFICSPNNPTGNEMAEADMVEILRSFPGIVIIDEAYADYSDSPSWISRIGEFPNLIVMRTLSKAWGLAGLRIGMAVADASIIAYMNRVKPPYNISTANQQLALNVLVKDEDMIRQQITQTRQQRQQVQEALNRLPIVVKTYPSSANFILAEFIQADSVYKQLLQAGIVVRNRSRQLPGCLRISIGTPSENEQLIQLLQQITV